MFVEFSCLLRLSGKSSFHYLINYFLFHCIFFIIPSESQFVNSSFYVIRDKLSKGEIKFNSHIAQPEKYLSKNFLGFVKYVNIFLSLTVIFKNYKNK